MDAQVSAFFRDPLGLNHHPLEGASCKEPYHPQESYHKHRPLSRPTGSCALKSLKFPAIFGVRIPLLNQTTFFRVTFLRLGRGKNCQDGMIVMKTGVIILST